jgi:nucleotide-binding universal stress UspA family protein
MRILFAGDEHPYSAYALKEVVNLARNTWADVTLLGVQPPAAAKEEGFAGAGAAALRRYRKDFLESWQGEESPYDLKNWRYEWVPLQDGLWEEMLVCRGVKKDLHVRVRVGSLAQEIVAEAGAEHSDLIVLGTTKGAECIWNGAPAVPQKVAGDAACSVLLVKEERPIDRILACLDQSYISQSSLEILNQMVTIHRAELEIIGLSPEGGLKKEVYTRLIELGDYYTDRQVKVATRLTDIKDFEASIAQEAKPDLLALWMGKKSLLQRFFPRDWVGRFVAKCQTSILVMR